MKVKNKLKLINFSFEKKKKLRGTYQSEYREVEERIVASKINLVVTLGLAPTFL
jgi:hypothetical protein